MKVLRGKHSHIPEVLQLVQDFIAESKWGWEYNLVNSTITLGRYIEEEDAELLVVESTGRLVGWAIIARDVDFHSDSLGYIVKFYIAKHARRTPAGRKLAQAAVDWFDHYKCTDSFAADTGNIPEQGKDFVNLFKKFGYRECGNTLVRRRPGHEQD